MRILQILEEQLREQAEPIGPDETYISLEKRVEEFLKSEREESDTDINKLEDAYIRLELDIMNQTNQLKKRIFGNQTIFYKSSRAKDKAKLGCLVHLTDNYLSDEEINCVR